MKFERKVTKQKRCLLEIRINDGVAIGTTAVNIKVDMSVLTDSLWFSITKADWFWQDFSILLFTRPFFCN